MAEIHINWLYRLFDDTVRMALEAHEDWQIKKQQYYLRRNIESQVIVNVIKAHVKRSHDAWVEYNRRVMDVIENVEDIRQYHPDIVRRDLREEYNLRLMTGL